jgi:hypothetical protein
MASFRILLSIMTVGLYVGGIACAIVALPFPPNVSSPGNFLWMASLAYVALAVWAILRGLLRNGVLCLMGGVVGAIVVAAITPAYGRVYEQYVAENSDAVAGVLHALTLITLVLPIYYLIRDRRDTHKQVRGEDRDRSREQRYLLYLAYAHYANAIILGVVGFISLLYQSIYVFLLTVDRAHATRESSHMLDNSLVIGASLFTVSLAAVVAFSAYFLQRRINYRACWAVAWIEFICIPMGPILSIVTLRLLSSLSIKGQFVDAGTK